ncbi:MAG: sulfatase, partial [Deltaproteobacteria bacterium]
MAVRVSDVRGAAAAVVRGSTAKYHRITIGGETRFGIPIPRASDGKKSLSLSLSVPADSVIHLAYGLEESTVTQATIRIKVAWDGTEKVLFTTRLEAKQEPGWTDLSLKLGGHQGEATLTLEVASVVPGREAPALSLSAPVITRPTSTQRRPSVILVSLDTLRADHLGIYGYDRDTSPNMDALFTTEGLVVDRVVSQAADTLYGHTALFTGMRPSTPLTSVPYGPTELSQLHSWALTLPEVLREAGYRTAAFTENALLVGPGVFNRGYEVYYEEKGIRNEIWKMRTTPGHIESTFGRGLKWLERHADQTVFLFLHTYQVHAPYEPPASLSSLYPTPPGSPLNRVEMDLYDREIRYTDDQVGKFVARLRQLGVLDNAILIITSDHGEEFGEHGAGGHGAHLTSEILHVPLLIRAPGLIPAGVRREGPFGLVDLMPTLLDLLGLDIPPNVTGASLASHLLEGTEGSTTPLFSEARGAWRTIYRGPKGRALDPDWKGPAFSVTSWPLRMVMEITKKGPPRYSLFHLDDDPGETSDLYNQEGADLGHMKRALDDYEKEKAR